MGEQKNSMPLSILLLEDHADTARVMEEFLSGLGHRVESEGSVADALKKMRAKNFDLLISDIALEDGSGVDLLVEARKFWHGPAIAVTGHGMNEDIRKYHAAGFTAHLVKPFPFDTLEKTIAEVAGGRPA